MRKPEKPTIGAYSSPNRANPDTTPRRPEADPDEDWERISRERRKAQHARFRREGALKGSLHET